MAEVFKFPPRVIVPPGLRTVLLGLGKAVVTRQPESIPEFSALYFTELLQFRAENPNADISELVRQFQVPRAKRLTSKSARKMAVWRRDTSVKGEGETQTSAPDAAEKSSGSGSLDEFENTDSIGSGRKTRFLSFRKIMKKGKMSSEMESLQSGTAAPPQ